MTLTIAKVSIGVLFFLVAVLLCRLYDKSQNLKKLNEAYELREEHLDAVRKARDSFEERAAGFELLSDVRATRVDKQDTQIKRLQTLLATRKAHIKSMDLYYFTRSKSDNDILYPEFLPKTKTKKAKKS